MVDKKWTVKKGMWGKNKHEKTVIVSYAGNFKEKKINEYLNNMKFTLLKWLALIKYSNIWSKSVLNLLQNHTV